MLTPSRLALARKRRGMTLVQLAAGLASSVTGRMTRSVQASTYPAGEIDSGSDSSA